MDACWGGDWERRPKLRGDFKGMVGGIMVKL